jgi:Ran GTPase-activating protein (RanGAP) involved in mRNA processing and transport
MLFTADVGTRRIAENLNKCSQLRSLDMSSNWIPDDAVCALVSHQSFFTTFSHLNLFNII